MKLVRIAPLVTVLLGSCGSETDSSTSQGAGPRLVPERGETGPRRYPPGRDPRVLYSADEPAAVSERRAAAERKRPALEAELRQRNAELGRKITMLVPAEPQPFGPLAGLHMRLTVEEATAIQPQLYAQPPDANRPDHFRLFKGTTYTIENKELRLRYTAGHDEKGRLAALVIGSGTSGLREIVTKAWGDPEHFRVENTGGPRDVWLREDTKVRVQYSGGGTFNRGSYLEFDDYTPLRDILGEPGDESWAESFPGKTRAQVEAGADRYFPPFKYVKYAGKSYVLATYHRGPPGTKISGDDLVKYAEIPLIHNRDSGAEKALWTFLVKRWGEPRDLGEKYFEFRRKPIRILAHRGERQIKLYIGERLTGQELRERRASE